MFQTEKYLMLILNFKRKIAIALLLLNILQYCFFFNFTCKQFLLHYLSTSNTAGHRKIYINRYSTTFDFTENGLEVLQFIQVFWVLFSKTIKLKSLSLILINY